MRNMLKNKILLITGGTGSFGNAVLTRLLDSGLKEIRIFSRDEKKQDDMRRRYANSKIKYYIGDVRDYGSIRNAAYGADFIFHAAALKQVPSCEFYPMEAVKTNILGTENVLDAAIECDVSRVVCLSTDKAVYPINAMGMSKAMMEKIVISKARVSGKTLMCITRYGNVMASRGSVVPLFLEQITQGVPITITDPNMTRFMMTLEDSVDLVLYAFRHGMAGDIFVQKAPATTVKTLAGALAQLMGKPGYEVKTIGTRHGEKLHEVLMSREEMVAAEDLGEYYRVVPDLRDLNYGKFFEDGEVRVSKTCDYNSQNAKRLSLTGLKSLLLKLELVQSTIRGRNFS